MSPKTPPKRSKGLKKKTDPPTEAAKRVNKKLGHSYQVPEILPFEATLAYVFRSAGGKQTAINASRLVMDQDERFKKVVYAFDTASPTDQTVLRLEDLLEAAEILPNEFLKIIIPALWQRNVDISRIVAAMAQPQLVEASVKTATTAGSFGFQDRKALLEVSGFYPTKPGMSINVDASHKTLVQGQQTTLVEGPKLPAFHEDAEFIANASNKTQKQLESSTKLLPPPVLEAEIVQPE